MLLVSGVAEQCEPADPGLVDRCGQRWTVVTEAPAGVDSGQQTRVPTLCTRCGETAGQICIPSPKDQSQINYQVIKVFFRW